MADHVVLLRAVNVGGATLPMARLRAIAGELGAHDVSTYIASGNLLCTPPGDPAEFDRALEARIEQEFGFFREVVGRSPAALRRALEDYPFEILEPRFAHICFLAGAPSPAAVADLASRDIGADLAQVIGRELHMRFAEGAASSRLTAPLITRVLGTPGTARNLRTIMALVDKAAS